MIEISVISHSFGKNENPSVLYHSDAKMKTVQQAEIYCGYETHARFIFRTLFFSLAPDGVWAGWYCRFEGCSRHQRALGRHWPSRIGASAATERTMPPRFWGIVAD